jgi:hypothetical protein
VTSRSWTAEQICASAGFVAGDAHANLIENGPQDGRSFSVEHGNSSSGTRSDTGIRDFSDSIELKCENFFCDGRRLRPRARCSSIGFPYFFAMTQESSLNLVLQTGQAHDPLQRQTLHNDREHDYRVADRQSSLFHSLEPVLSAKATETAPRNPPQVRITIARQRFGFLA